MFGITGIALYLIIFIGKVAEVSLSTIRTVLITKGEKVIGSIMGFFEILLWIFIVSSILTDLTSDPFKIVAFALGFVFGIYIGAAIEQKIGMGTFTIMTVVDKEVGNSLAEKLRKHNLGVTILHGAGKDCSKDILMMIVKRKAGMEVVNLIKTYEENAVITISETKPIYGGYGKIK